MLCGVTVFQLLDFLPDLILGLLHQRNVDFSVFGLLGLKSVDVELHLVNLLLDSAEVVLFLRGLV
jgi:hypothetical protein